MNRHVNAIAGRLSLRAPQRDSLEILARVAEITPLTKDQDVAAGSSDDPLRIPHRHRLRARVPVAVLCACDRRGQDTADGGFHRLPLPCARGPPLLRSGAQPHDLQQADPRLHAQHAEVRAAGDRRVRQQPARDHHGRQLRERAEACARNTGLPAAMSTSTFSTSPRSTPRCGVGTPRESSACRSTSGRATSSTSRAWMTSCCLWTSRTATGPVPACAPSTS